MFAMTQKTGPLAETLRMIRATIRRLTLVPTTEPAPYWADYLRETPARTPETAPAHPGRFRFAPATFVGFSDPRRAVLHSPGQR